MLLSAAFSGYGNPPRLVVLLKVCISGDHGVAFHVLWFTQSLTVCCGVALGLVFGGGLMCGLKL